MPDKSYNAVTRHELADRLTTLAAQLADARETALACCAVAGLAGDEIRAEWLYHGICAELQVRAIQARANAQSVDDGHDLRPERRS